jgi:Ca2+-binding RTX toxin-like protein
VLAGLGGNDSISGGAGNDIVRGGEGADILRGGAGLDVFEYTEVLDSGVLAPNMDTIMNFASGSDRIDLAAMDANNTAADGDQAFTFVGSAEFSGTDATGQVRFTYDADTDTGMLQGSIDADADAEFAISLPGVSSLEAADLVL